MTPTPEPDLDVRGLGFALWTSRVWVMATTDAAFRIVAASPHLEATIGRPLGGAPIVEIVTPTQQPAFLDGLRAAGPAWSELRLGLIQDADSMPVDYRIRVRADGEGLVVVGEPDIADATLVTEQLLGVTEDLISEQRKLSIEGHRLTRLTTTDPLTGLGNRRSLEAELKVRLDAAAGDGSAVSVVFADIDHFKRINDEFGHGVGDLVLRFVADLLGSACRADDTVARYGGEEFVAVLPRADAAGAARWAERARVAMASQQAPEIGRTVTGSFGVARHEPGESADQLLARADAALYVAKSTGRDRVAMAEVGGTASAIEKAPAPDAEDRQEHLPRLSEILWQSAGMGVAEFGADDHLTGANPAFERLLGPDLVGRALPELVARSQADAIERFLASAGTDWVRGQFGLATEPMSVPIDRVLWLRRGAVGLDLIVDVDPELPERTQAPLLGLIDDLVTTQRALTHANQRLQQTLDALGSSDREVRNLRALVPICAWCHRIRVDDRDDPMWLSTEAFLQRGTEGITHTICDDCQAREGVGLSSGEGLSLERHQAP